MGRAALCPEKAATWSRAESAIDALRDDESLSYRAAADRFGVGLWQLKRRVIYRYGGLDALRAGLPALTVYVREDESKRCRCMRCGELRFIREGFRMCGGCHEAIRGML